MTIQQLSVFLAVYEELNYTRAAARVYMSRQAVRQNIAELERELSGALFENRRNRLSPTAKGELLHSKAAPLVESFQELQRSMNADIRLDRPLALGISVALVPDYLPRLEEYLAGFSRSYPNIPLSTLRLENDEAAPALLAGAVDACLVMDMGGQRPGLERSALTRHPAAVLMKAQPELERKGAVDPMDLDGERLFVPGLGAEFEPLLRALEAGGAAVVPVVMPSFYQALFHILDHDGKALNRFDSRDGRGHEPLSNLPLRGVPPLCCSFLVREGDESAPLRLLRDWLAVRLREEFAPEQP